MNNDKEFIISNHESIYEIGRRDFLKKTAFLAALPLLGGLGTALTPASASAYTPPARQRGSTVRNVKNYGAVGNGSKNDTAAIQKAINSLPSGGGTVYIPAGTYMIDALTSIKLRSYMHLKLHTDARLKAIPNSSIKYNVVLADVVKEVEISGGQILGERGSHRGTEGEGGHCIRIRGSQNITVRDIRLANGWGDGLVVGPKPVYRKNYIYSRNVAINNIVCDNNRRNGLSIGNVIGIKVYNSKFLNTNGTKPQCGIDVEPDKDIDESGYCDQVRIENCLLAGNARYGINIWRRTHNITLTKCTIEKNGTCGMVADGLTGGTFTDNVIRRNQSTGVFIKPLTSDVAINGNTFYDNYLKQGTVNRTPFCKSGIPSNVRKDIIVHVDAVNIRVGSNCYE